MAGKGRQSAEKRRIDKLRQEQQAAKRERRHNRNTGGGADDGATPGGTQDELMERFRLLSEAHAAGRVTDEEFGPARHELMVALGDDAPEDDEDD